jgi:co-chaperonin GroES (HSP10)
MKAAIAEIPVTKKKIYRATPFSKWVLVKPIEIAEKKTEAGVVVPGADSIGMPSDVISQTGHVVAAAEGVPLNRGDLVLFTRHAMTFRALDELTGIPGLKLVRFEECYCGFEEITETE